MKGSKKRATTSALLGALACALLVAAPAFAEGPSVYNGASMTKPASGAAAKYGSISASGCVAKTAAKSDRGQTIFTDNQSSNSLLFCDYVRVRLFYLSGSSSYYSAWDKDFDSAEVKSTTYTSTSHQMAVSSVD